MIINFPTTYSEDEEKLMRKLASLKKKRKQLLDTKTSKEQQNAQTIALKRSSTDSPSLKDDAKEVAKKLIKSGAIKLEVESKEKGFKRSLSRNEKRPFQTDSILSPKISFSPQPDTQSYRQTSPSVQTPNRFNTTNRFNFNNTNRPHFGTKSGHKGFILHIKGDGITEEYLRQTFEKHASNINVLSIEMKKTYSFVTVENKQAADESIKILNGNTYNEIKLSVSYARLPRYGSSFDRPYQSQQQNQQQSTVNLNEDHSSNTALDNWNEITQTPTHRSPSSSHTPRNLVTYEDDQNLFQ